MIKAAQKLAIGSIFLSLGLYAGAAFAPLDSLSLSCPEEFGLVPVPGNEELGMGPFCMEGEARIYIAPVQTSAETQSPACNVEEDSLPCEEDPSLGDASEFLSTFALQDKPAITLAEALEECRHLNTVFATEIEGTGTEFDLISKRGWDTLKSNIAQEGMNVRGPYIVLSNDTVIYTDDNLLEWVKKDQPAFSPSQDEGDPTLDDSFAAAFQADMNATDEDSPVLNFQASSRQSDFLPANATLGFRCVLRPVQETEETFAQVTEGIQANLMDSHLRGKDGILRDESHSRADGNLDPRLRGGDGYRGNEGVRGNPGGSRTYRSTGQSPLDNILSLSRKRKLRKRQPKNANQNNGGSNQNRGRSIVPRSSHPTASIAAVHSQSSMIDKAQFRVTLSSAATSSTTVSVNLSQASSWFASSELSKTVTFNTGEDEKTFELSPRTNFPTTGTGHLNLANGNLTATLQTGTGYNIHSTAGSATVRMFSSYPLLKVRMTEASYQVTEGNSLTFTLEALTEEGVPKPQSDLTRKIAFQTFPGIDNTAQLDVDFQHVSETITLSPGDFTQSGNYFIARKTFTIRTLEDGIDEGAENFVILLYNNLDDVFIAISDSDWRTCTEINGDNRYGCDKGAFITIIDDDMPKGVAISPLLIELESEETTASYSVVLNSQPTANVTITPSISSGGTGASVSPTSLSFTPSNWNSAQTVTVTFAGGRNSSTVIGHAVSGGDYGSVTAPSVTIGSDDSNIPPRVNIRRVKSKAKEGDNFEFKIRLSRAASQEIQVPYRLIAHSGAEHPATAGADYSAQDAGVAVFSAGEQEKRVRFASTEDNRLEYDETFKVELYNLNPNQVSPGNLMSEVLTIEDDDNLWISFEQRFISSTEGLRVSEGVGSVRVVVKKLNPSDIDFPFDVNLSIIDDTATYPEDYGKNHAVLYFAKGDTQQSVSVPIVDDSELENKERILLFMFIPYSSSPDIVKVRGGDGAITILDNDPTVVSVAPAQRVEGLKLNFDVTLSHTRTQNVSVRYDTSIASGDTAETGDFTRTRGTLTFAPGETKKTVSVPTTTDTDTDNETFTFSLLSTGLQNATLGTATATGTIFDKTGGSLPEILVADESGILVESGSTLKTLTAYVTPFDLNPNAITLTLSMSDPGVIELSSNTLTIPANARSGSITYRAIDNDLYDDFGYNCTQLRYTTDDPAFFSEGYDQLSICTQEDEAKPTIKLRAMDGTSAYQEAEEGETFRVKAILSGPSVDPTVVSYRTQNATATAPADFTAKDERLVFAPGETEKIIEIATIEDDILEPSQEAFTVEIYQIHPRHNGQDATDIDLPTASSKITLAITDNDQVNLSLPQDFAVNEDVGNISFTIRSDKRIETPVTFNVIVKAIAGGATLATTNSFTEGTDLYGVSTQVTMGAGEMEISASIPIWDDGIVEDNEAFEVVLEEVTGHDYSRINFPSDNSTTITILDNDTRGISITPLDIYPTRQGDTETYDVVLQTKPTGNVVITPNFTSGGAGASVSPTSLTFTPGNWNTTQRVNFTAGSEDTVIEHRVSGTNDYVDNNVPAPTVNASLDDPNLPPRLNLLSANNDRRGNVNEGETVMAKVILSRPATRRIRIPYEVRAGTTIFGEDLSDQSGTVTFNVGEREKTLSFNTIDNPPVENDESFFVTLLTEGLESQVTPGNKSILYTIKDDDSALLTVIPDKEEVSESEGVVHFTIRLSNPAELSFRFMHYTSYTSDGSDNDVASDLNDERIIEQFAPNQLEMRVSREIVDDKVVEEDKQIYALMLRQNGTHERIILEGGAFTLIDDDEHGWGVTPGTVLEVNEGESVSYQLQPTSAHESFILKASLSGSQTASLIEGENTLWSQGMQQGFTIFPVLDSFTPYSRSFILQTQHDADENDEEIIITHTVSAGNYEILPSPITVRVYDDEGRGIKPIAGSERNEEILDHHRQMDLVAKRLGNNTASGLWLAEGWSRKFLVKVSGSTASSRVVDLTATAGSPTTYSSDYHLFVEGKRIYEPYRITIPAGRRSVELTVKAIKDGYDGEGTETLILSGSHDGRPLSTTPTTIYISPCGGSDPEAFAWLSVDGENTLRRHDPNFNVDDPIQGPNFKLRVCFRDKMRGVSIGSHGSLSIIGSEGSLSELFTDGDLSGLTEKVSGQIWTADVTAHEAGQIYFFLNLHDLQYAGGNAVQSRWQSIGWQPAVNSGIAPRLDPLTARFVQSPSREHNGVHALTFQVKFSDLVYMGENEMRFHALQVDGARVTSVVGYPRENGDPALSAEGKGYDLWEIEVTPRGEEDITINFPVPESCESGNRGALCTQDERPLSQALSAMIEGPEVEEPEIPQPGNNLTAEFLEVPPEFYGRFKVKIAFSEPIVTSAHDIMRRRSIKISDTGRIENLTKVNGRSDLWEFTVIPISYKYSEDISIRLSPDSSDCNNSRSICTADNKSLHNKPSATIKAPARVIISDASAREGVDAYINFKLTLSRPLRYPASVGWVSRDGTAKNGEDFEGGRGTIQFSVGDTSKTLSLPIIDDAVDEGEEHFTVMLQDKNRLMIDYDSFIATGTITNDDPMPRAWLSRFGRTVGSQAVEAISGRMGASKENKVVIGGVEASSGAGQPEDLETRIRRDRFERSAFSWKDEEEAERTMTMEEVLSSSSFNWRSQSKEPGGNVWSAWGQFMTGNFSGSEDDVNVEGEVRSGFLGADLTSRNWRGGFALSQSEGKGSFDLLSLDSRTCRPEDSPSRESGNLPNTCSPNDTIDRGTVESRLTSFYPYAGYELGENKAVWGILGFGEGDMSIVQKADEDRAEDKILETDISMRMGAVGAKSLLLSLSDGDPLDVIIQTDGMYVRMDSEAAKGMEAAKAEVTRLRLMLDSSRAFELGEGTLTPTFQMGVRHDGGDAEKGVGLEAGGKLSYQQGGLTIEGSVRKLLAHEDKNYEEWGASAALRVDPGKSGRGLSLSITPTWGEPSSNIDRIWSAEGGAHQFGNGDFEAQNRLEAEIGYGLFNPFKKLFGILTPYFGLSLGDSNRVTRTGTRWVISPNANLGLELSRTKGESKEGDDKAIMLQGGFQW